MCASNLEKWPRQAFEVSWFFTITGLGTIALPRNEQLSNNSPKHAPPPSKIPNIHPAKFAKTRSGYHVFDGSATQNHLVSDGLFLVLLLGVVPTISKCLTHDPVRLPGHVSHSFWDIKASPPRAHHISLLPRLTLPLGFLGLPGFQGFLIFHFIANSTYVTFFALSGHLVSLASLLVNKQEHCTHRNKSMRLEERYRTPR